jgi:hypothetical protein
LTIASELSANGIREYPPSKTATILDYIYRRPLVIQANPTGVTFILPSTSFFAESKPAEIIIKSGLNSLIIGNRRE